MKKTLKTPKRRAPMEELEPRLLFSASLSGVLAGAALMDVDERPRSCEVASSHGREHAGPLGIVRRIR
jgi:hypothetical protein